MGQAKDDGGNGFPLHRRRIFDCAGMTGGISNIEQGISNYEVEIAFRQRRTFSAALAMTIFKIDSRLGGSRHRRIFDFDLDFAALRSE